MQDPQPDRIWYLPHHPVEKINKPGKVRRVANAASKFRGQSLNSNLLTGPDLLYNPLGVLMRFREHPVAVLADIEGMFMQIAIHQIDRSALRFLWLADNQIQQYQFTKLIFEANCSPSCAIYVLNHCAKENIQHFPEALKAVRKHFYMDDYIQSHATEKDACKTSWNKTLSKNRWNSTHKICFKQLYSPKPNPSRWQRQPDRYFSTSWC